MPFLEMLHDWQSFYVVTGGAAAALIGLMFVGVSLGSHLITTEMMGGIRTYVNPTLFHFVAVLTLSCTMLVPSHSAASWCILVGLISLAGLRQTIAVVGGMQQRQLPDSIEAAEDNHGLWHGLLPLLSYVLGCAVVIGAAISGLPDWLNGLALTVVTLLVCAIHNTWVLVLWIARQRVPN